MSTQFKYLLAVLWTAAGIGSALLVHFAQSAQGRFGYTLLVLFFTVLATAHWVIVLREMTDA